MKTTGISLLKGKPRRILGVAVIAACGCKNPLRCEDCEGDSVVTKDATADELRAFMGLRKVKR